MERIIHLALKLAADYTLKGIRLNTGLMLKEVDTLCVEVPEILWSDLNLITIYSKLPNVKKREYVAHAIGHYFLHRRNPSTFFEFLPKFTHNREIEADAFAAYFLVPTWELQRALLSHKTIESLSQHFGVTYEFIAFRLGLEKILNIC